MKLLVSALSGTVAACLIFAMIVMIPLQAGSRVLLGVSVGGDSLLRLEGPKGVAYQEPKMGSPPCVLNVTLYEFSKPLGPGSESKVVITLTSQLNASAAFYVTAQLFALRPVFPEWQEDFPGGMEFLAGNSEWSWNGTVEANETKTFQDGIRVTEIGSGVLSVDAGSSQLLQRVNIDIFTLPDNVFAWSQDPSPEPRVRMSSVVTTYDFYHGLSVGSEFNVSARVGIASASGTDLTLKIITGEGIASIRGEPTWAGIFPLLNETADHYYVDLSAGMKLVKPGAWFMCVVVEKNGILYTYPCIIKYESVGNEFIEKWLVKP